MPKNINDLILSLVYLGFFILYNGKGGIAPIWRAVT
jgi:hypothetical protein